MNGVPQLAKVELAYFKTLPPGGARGEKIDVHFNPTSLQYTVSNTLKEEGSGSSKKQFVDKTTAKLTMQLVFDTTDTGQDVRKHTDKMAGLLKPVSEGNKQVPPNVEFGWGVYSFTGMVEQYKETLDFFAANGVPLRATVDITLASQDVQFESAGNRSASVDRNLTPEPAVVPAGSSPSGLANSLGDPRAARAIAAANGSASLRFGGGAGLAVGAGVELKAEAAFSVGGGAGIGVGGGVGVGIGAGGIGGVGLGIGVAGGAAAGIGIGGALGGARVSAGRAAQASIGAAAGGAFGGLRTSVSTTSTMPSARALVSKSTGVGAVGAGAQIGLGGKAQMQAGASLGADVGAEADLSALIRFS